MLLAAISTAQTNVGCLRSEPSEVASQLRQPANCSRSASYPRDGVEAEKRTFPTTTACWEFWLSLFWDGGSRDSPGASERFQKIMKQQDGIAHGYPALRWLHADESMSVRFSQRLKPLKSLRLPPRLSFVGSHLRPAGCGPWCFGLLSINLPMDRFSAFAPIWNRAMRVSPANPQRVFCIRLAP